MSIKSIAAKTLLNIFNKSSAPNPWLQQQAVFNQQLERLLLD
jgi:hypothetical protein